MSELGELRGRAGPMLEDRIRDAVAEIERDEQLFLRFGYNAPVLTGHPGKYWA